MTTQMKNIDKRIAIFSNHKPQSKEICQLLIQKLRQNHFVLTDKNPDIVISIGGDGMLLSVFHKYEDQLDKVRFVLPVVWLKEPSLGRFFCNKR